MPKFRELIIELSKKGHTIIMASHLLDEVEKSLHPCGNYKKGELITTGPVEDVMLDDDRIELSAANMDSLHKALQLYNSAIKINKEGDYFIVTCPKGQQILRM